MARTLNICFEKITFKFSIRSIWIHSIKLAIQKDSHENRKQNRIAWPESFKSLLIWPIVPSSKKSFSFANPFERTNITFSTDRNIHSIGAAYLLISSYNLGTEHSMKPLWSPFLWCHHQWQCKWDNLCAILQPAYQRNDNHFIAINESHWATSFTPNRVNVCSLFALQ